MSKRDYYEVMGISKNADDNEIKKAYRQLVKKYHPDIHPDKEQAETMLKEINEAYEVLSDPQKRAQYDQFGHVGPGGGFGAGGQDMGGFGDIFDMFFGGGFGGGSSPTGPQRGNDLRFNMEIAFEEAAFGVEKEVELPRMEACDVCGGNGSEPGTKPNVCNTCKGSGQVRTVAKTMLGNIQTMRTCPDCHGEGQIITKPCKHCKGKGRVRKSRRIRVNIPGGVDSGMRIRVPGEGEGGQRGGPAGDLYVFVEVRPHALFEREGEDVLCHVPINIVQATLGGEIEIPTLDGKVNVKIPEGTQNGTVQRIRGKGIKRLRGTGRGDQRIYFHVTTPTKLTDKQKELLEEFGRTLSDDNANTEKEKSFFRKVRDLFV
ncbi:molecular chaperone DnaJ [Heliophilum fasciatum]|uniref:Chaperone protein DnaJ n=1 Tax=Heliophilum fasciatum TaxID=35700 RepID=A0A4R2RW67_9FIRM|nr:molecular chaperone DnaJ [Heliophilum fasciatum]MCW2278131.1 molecular chaperone DnaJ [Heliophilum fasciatum]TCP64201.1 molecular chaperone DnaJ [Heliophilum fasciatum]